VVQGGEFYVHLKGLIDIGAEKTKQLKEKQKLEKYIQSIKSKLDNENFKKNAPQELVEGEILKMSDATEKIFRIQHSLNFLEN
jgi:valyl-tRNA synthetase